MMRPPFQIFLSRLFFHFRCPALPPGAVLPPFNDLFSAYKGKYQGVALAGLQSRYFTETANLVGNGF